MGADYFIVASASENNEGISLFLVPSKSDGIEIEKMEAIGGDKLSKVNFQEIKLLDYQLLGKEGEAWKTLSKVFNYGAIGNPNPRVAIIFF